MKATYYNIRSLITDEIVDEGIVHDSDSIITPSQNTGIIELPYECKLSEAMEKLNFEYSIEKIRFEINRKDIIRLAIPKRKRK